jgi:hypothetical protein
MKSYFSRLSSMGIASGVKAVLQKTVLLGASTALLTMSFSNRSSANYNVMPYYNPICKCCVSPGTVMNEIFTGTGLWTSQDDFQNDFYVSDLFDKKVEPALQEMTDNYRNAIVAYPMMIGAFIDGQATLNSLSSLQKLNARAMNSHQVSDQICRFGTLTRSLALSEDKSRTVQIGLMEQIQARQLMKDNMNAGDASGDGTTIGRSADKIGRWKQFQEKFCDASDLNRSLDGSVTAGAAEKCNATSDVQQNRDIDLTRTLQVPKSLELNFATGAATLTKDEENIIALGENLYAHDLSVNLGRSDIAGLKQNAKDEQIRKLFDFRSLVAKRSVAANSYAAQAGMKAEGGSESKKYMESLAKELGLSTSEDLKALLGENPSYYTQMDFLAKRLYQTPKFYANLYDSPNNVGRQQTAMKAISLMQDRDIFESLQRSEMLLSTLMEIYVLKEQDRYFGKGIKN